MLARDHPGSVPSIEMDPIGFEEASMRLSRTDLLPVLAIMFGGTVGVLASGFVFVARSDHLPPDVLIVPDQTSVASAVPPLLYIDGVRVAYDPGTLRIEGSLRGGYAFTSSAVRSALEQWLEMTGTSPQEIDGVEGIEVIRGRAAVTQFGDDASGGVILVSLRRAPAGSVPLAERGVPPVWEEARYAVAPRILNIGEVRRAMFAAYPARLREARVGGTVRVHFFIDEHGDVQGTRIDETSGNTALDEAALTVADVFRFSAALNGDQPVPAWTSHSLSFEVR